MGFPNRAFSVLYLRREYLVRCPARVVALEHRAVREEGGIVEVLCPRRAVAHAGVAFDAHAHDLGDIIGIDRAHRAEGGAHAAVDTLVEVGLGLRLQKHLRFAIEAQRAVIGRVRVAVDRDGRGILRHLHDAAHDRRAELCKLRHIVGIGSAVGKRVGKGVAAGKGTRADGVETVSFETGAELGKGIVKAAVAERHDRHGQRAVSAEAGLYKVEQLIRQLSRIGRHTEDDKVALGKIIGFLTRGGEREIAHLERDVKADGQCVCKRGGHLSGVAGGAEIDCVDLSDVHGCCLFFLYCSGRCPALQGKILGRVLVVQRGGTGRHTLERIVAEMAAVVGRVDDAAAGADDLRVVDDAAALAVGAVLFNVLAKQMEHGLSPFSFTGCG